MCGVPPPTPKGGFLSCRYSCLVLLVSWLWERLEVGLMRPEFVMAWFYFLMDEKAFNQKLKSQQDEKGINFRVIGNINFTKQL